MCHASLRPPWLLLPESLDPVLGPLLGILPQVVLGGLPLLALLPLPCGTHDALGPFGKALRLRVRRTLLCHCHAGIGRMLDLWLGGGLSLRSSLPLRGALQRTEM